MNRAMVALALLLLASIGFNAYTYTRLHKAENHIIDLSRRIDTVAGDLEQLQSRPDQVTETPEAASAATPEDVRRLRVETDSRFATICERSGGRICP
jgi:hypothetical protein